MLNKAYFIRRIIAISIMFLGTVSTQCHASTDFIVQMGKKKLAKGATNTQKYTLKTIGILKEDKLLGAEDLKNFEKNYAVNISAQCGTNGLRVFMYYNADSAAKQLPKPYITCGNGEDIIVKFHSTGGGKDADSIYRYKGLLHLNEDNAELSIVAPTPSVDTQASQSQTEGEYSNNNQYTMKSTKNVPNIPKNIRPIKKNTICQEDVKKEESINQAKKELKAKQTMLMQKLKDKLELLQDCKVQLQEVVCQQLRFAIQLKATKKAMLPEVVVLEQIQAWQEQITQETEQLEQIVVEMRQNTLKEVQSQEICQDQEESNNLQLNCLWQLQAAQDISLSELIQKIEQSRQVVAKYEKQKIENDQLIKMELEQAHKILELEYRMLELRDKILQLKKQKEQNNILIAEEVKQQYGHQQYTSLDYSILDGSVISVKPSESEVKPNKKKGCC